jgi:hypothetical protein
MLRVFGDVIIESNQFAAMEILECEKEIDVRGFIIWIYLVSGTRFLFKHNFDNIDKAREYYRDNLQDYLEGVKEG